jgi:hypothetical protein
MEGVLGEFGNLKIRDIYRQIDSKYIKPCLLRDNKVTQCHESCFLFPEKFGLPKFVKNVKIRIIG